MLLINSVFWQEYSLTISRLVYAAQWFELFSENELYGQIRKKSRICLSCPNTLSIGRCTSNGFGIDCSFHSYLIIQNSVNERIVLTKVVSKKIVSFLTKVVRKRSFRFLFIRRSVWKYVWKKLVKIPKMTMASLKYTA